MFKFAACTFSLAPFHPPCYLSQHVLSEHWASSPKACWRVHFILFLVSGVLENGSSGSWSLSLSGMPRMGGISRQLDQTCWVAKGWCFRRKCRGKKKYIVCYGVDCPEERNRICDPKCEVVDLLETLMWNIQLQFIFYLCLSHLKCVLSVLRIPSGLVSHFTLLFLAFVLWGKGIRNICLIFFFSKPSPSLTWGWKVEPRGLHYKFGGQYLVKLYVCQNACCCRDAGLHLCVCVLRLSWRAVPLYTPVLCSQACEAVYQLPLCYKVRKQKSPTKTLKALQKWHVQFSSCFLLKLELPLGN